MPKKELRLEDLESQYAAFCENVRAVKENTYWRSAFHTVKEDAYWPKHSLHGKRKDKDGEKTKKAN